MTPEELELQNPEFTNLSLNELSILAAHHSKEISRTIGDGSALRAMAFAAGDEYGRKRPEGRHPIEELLKDIDRLRRFVACVDEHRRAIADVAQQIANPA